VKEIRRVGKHDRMVQLNPSRESRDLYGHRKSFSIWAACEVDVNGDVVVMI
jgi:hypothetical protein